VLLLRRPDGCLRCTSCLLTSNKATLSHLLYHNAVNVLCHTTGGEGQRESSGTQWNPVEPSGTQWNPVEPSGAPSPETTTSLSLKFLSDQMSSPASSIPPVLLNTGLPMPFLGLGTYKLVVLEDVCRAVDAALGAGYRAFDSAAVYRNEAQLGRALKELLPKHGLTREDVFITR